jgi:hypothetical protein
VEVEGEGGLPRGAPVRRARPELGLAPHVVGISHQRPHGEHSFPHSDGGRGSAGLTTPKLAAGASAFSFLTVGTIGVMAKQGGR